MNFEVNWLDATTAALGLAYIILEYRASVWLWVVGFVMQALGIVLYYQKGLYADCGMEFYYLSVTVYGFVAWQYGHRRKAAHSQDTDKNTATPLPVTRFPRRLLWRWTAVTLLLWAVIWWLLTTFTDSRVPVADSFTTALSVVGIWALARKYLEQWLIWIAVDVVTCGLYFFKDIPFKATLYALYVVIAIFGYRRWRRLCQSGRG